MKRLVIAVCLLLGTLLIIALAGCGSEPPFETITGDRMIEQAEPGFGNYILPAVEPAKISVYSTELTFVVDGTELSRGVDIYYPPRFAFRAPKPTVFGGNGSRRWTANVTWAMATAEAGLVAVVTDVMFEEREVYETQINTLLERAEEFFIDVDRLAFWTSGHGATLPLTMVMREEFPWRRGVRAMVCESSVMQVGEELFVFDPEQMHATFPILLATAEQDSFYEVRRSAELFVETSSSIGIDVTWQTCPGIRHHWMHVDGDPAMVPVDEGALQLAREEIDFVQRHL